MADEIFLGTGKVKRRRNKDQGICFLKTRKRMSPQDCLGSLKALLRWKASCFNSTHDGYAWPGRRRQMRAFDHPCDRGQWRGQYRRRRNRDRTGLPNRNRQARGAGLRCDTRDSPFSIVFGVVGCEVANRGDTCGNAGCGLRRCSGRAAVCFRSSGSSSSFLRAPICSGSLCRSVRPRVLDSPIVPRWSALAPVQIPGSFVPEREVSHE